MKGKILGARHIAVAKRRCVVGCHGGFVVRTEIINETHAVNRVVRPIEFLKDVAKIIRNKDIAHQFSCHLASFHIPVAHTHVTQVAQRYGASFGIRAALSHASGKSLGYRLYRKAF